MSDLTSFVLARIAEDERFAHQAMGGGDGHWASWNRSWDTSPTRDLAADGVRVAALPMTIDEHVCRHDPARVLAECEAKRRIVEEHPAERYADVDERFCKRCRAGLFEREVGWPCATLRSLALPYADHEQFREEWR